MQETAASPQARMERVARQHLQNWVGDFLWRWENTTLTNQEAAALVISTLRHLVDIVDESLSVPPTETEELVKVFINHLEKIMKS